MVRISDKIKEEIFEDYVKGMNKKDLSIKYNTSRVTINRILSSQNPENDENLIGSKAYRKKESEPQTINDYTPKKINVPKFNLIKLPEIELKEVRHIKKDQVVKEEVRQPDKTTDEFYENIRKKFLKEY